MKKGVLMLVMAAAISACSSAEKTTGEEMVTKENEAWWLEAGEAEEAESEYWWVYSSEDDVWE